jgi:hypothetical protein
MERHWLASITWIALPPLFARRYSLGIYCAWNSVIRPPTLSINPQIQILTKTISDIYKEDGGTLRGITGRTIRSLIEVEYTFKLQYPDIVEKGSAIPIQVMLSINETITRRFIVLEAFDESKEPRYLDKQHDNIEAQLKDKVLRAFESGKVRLRLHIAGADVKPEQLKSFSEKNPSEWSVYFPNEGNYRGIITVENDLSRSTVFEVLERKMTSNDPRTHLILEQSGGNTIQILAYEPLLSRKNLFSLAAVVLGPLVSIPGLYAFWKEWRNRAKPA